MAQTDFINDLKNAAEALNKARKDGIIDQNTQEEQMNRMLDMHDAIISKKKEGFQWDLKSETIGKNIKRWAKGKVDDANNLKKVKKQLVKEDRAINRMVKLEKKLASQLTDEQKKHLKGKIEQAKVEKGISDVNYKMAKASSSKLGGVMAGVSNFGSIASNLLSPLSGIFKLALSIGTALFKTIFPIEKAWKMFLNMQSAVGGLSADIGLTNNEYRKLIMSMPTLYNDIVGYGGKIEDIATIIKGFSENTGKNRLFSNEEIEDIVKLGYSTGLGVQGVTDMVSEFDNLGYSLADTMKTADKGRKVATKFSLNQTKLLKTTTDVVKNLTGSAFGRSVEDLTKLSAKAQSLRFNLAESIKSFKDSFFSPEKAVEAAARIQVLGGEMAQQFGNPFNLMYESMNNADGMAERLINTAKNIATKNKNGQFIIPPAERQILREQVEALGQNYDEVVNAGIEQTKTLDKLTALNKSAGSLLNFNDDDQQALANLMTMNKSGAYEIKMPNGVKKLVSNITGEDQLKNILSARKANESAAQQRLNLSERFSIVLDRFAIGLTPLFTQLDKFLQDEGTLKKIEDLGDAIANQMIPFIDELFKPDGTLDTGLKFFLNDFNKFLTDAKGIMDGEGKFFTKIKDVMSSMVGFIAQTILPYVQYIFGSIFSAMKDIPVIGSSLGNTGQELMAKSFVTNGKRNEGIIKMAGGDEAVRAKMMQGNVARAENNDTGAGTYASAAAIGAAGGALFTPIGALIGAAGGLITAGIKDAFFDDDEVKNTYTLPPPPTIESAQDAMVYSDGRIIKGSKGDAVAFIDEMAARNTYSSNGSNNNSTMVVNVSGTIEHDTPNGSKTITAEELYASDPQMFGKYIEATMAQQNQGSANYRVSFGVSPINNI